MEIVYKKLNEITPYENNPRDNDKAVPYVANSIKRFGFKVPIVIDRNGVIAAGHTRYKAAKELGMDTVPCIMADDLDDDDIKAFRLADNKVSELADWNPRMLEIEMGEIPDIDMSEFGFIGDLYFDEMEPIDVDEVGGQESNISKISVDGKSWQIANDEAAIFMKAMDDYIEENGVSFGFIREVFGD